MQWMKKICGMRGAIGRTPHSAEDFALISYTIAYRSLPRLLARPVVAGFEKWLEDPDAVRDSLYRVGCIMAQRTMQVGQSQRILAHVGVLGARHEYFIFEYPKPPGYAPEMGNRLLAPYFSAVIRDTGDGKCEYYVLGQSPDGGTTIRSVQEDEHTLVGGGVEPTLECWIAHLRHKYLDDPRC